MKLNADVGEGFDETALIPRLDQVNIACGFHAGDPLSMQRSIRLALAHELEIGAHPGYPDRENFGRRSLNLDGETLIAQIRYQVGALEALLRAEGGRLSYVKPHGALYHDLLNRPALFEAMLNALVTLAAPGHDSPPALMLMAGPASARLDRERARTLGVPLLFEAFADRRYQPCGRLAPRDEPNACLNGAEAVRGQVAALLRGDPLPGLGQPLRADSLCIHGDHPRAAEHAAAARQALQAQP